MKTEKKPQSDVRQNQAINLSFKSIYKFLILFFTIFIFIQSIGTAQEMWRVDLNQQQNSIINHMITNKNGYTFMLDIGRDTSSDPWIYYYLLECYTPEGDLAWYKNFNLNEHEPKYSSMDVDSYDNVYIFGSSDLYGSLYRKYSISGDLIASVEFPAYAYESGEWSHVILGVDNDGNLIVSGEQITYGEQCEGYIIGRLQKASSSGAIDWSHTFGSAENSLQSIGILGVDNSGGILARYSTNIDECGREPAEDFIVKLDTNGNEKWTRPKPVGSVYYQPSGNLYNSAGNGWFSGSYYIALRDTGFNVVWSIDFSDYISSVIENHKDGGALVIFGGSLPVYLNSDGTIRWTSSRYYRDIKIGPDGNIYSKNNGNIYCINPATGEDIWTYSGAINNAKGIFLDKNNSVYLYSNTELAKYENFKITSPELDDKWIAGETDTIKWTGGDSLLLFDIFYSEDDGENYTLIVEDYNSASNSYVWDIPDDILSTKMKIKIEKSEDGSLMDESELFRIKPYIITKIDEDGNYVAYDILTDRWGFSNVREDVWPQWYYSRINYQGIDPFTNMLYESPYDSLFLNAKSSDFTDWESFVNAFTVDACYLNVFSGIYDPMALELWKYFKRPWEGSCFAVAGSNALAFSVRESFLNVYNNFSNFNSPIGVNSGEGIISDITTLYSHNLGNPTVQHQIDNHLNKTPNQTLQELREVLSADTVNPRTLSFWHTSESKGHSVLPYKISKNEFLDGFYSINIYDNADALDFDATIEIDSEGNGEWYSLTYFGWGGNNKLILELDARTYLTPPTLFWLLPNQNNNLMAGQEKSSYPTQDKSLKVFVKNDLDILIFDENDNKTGYSKSTLFEEIDGAVPTIIPTGGLSIPSGYDLPNKEYSIKLDNFQNGKSMASYFHNDIFYSYERKGASETQTDYLKIGAGLMVSNVDAQEKDATLKAIVKNSSDYNIFQIHSVSLSENDSINLLPTDSDCVHVMNCNMDKEYSVAIKHASSSGVEEFNYMDLSLQSNASHIFCPDWTDLENKLMMVLVDELNDGNINDTLWLENRITNIGNQKNLGFDPNLMVKVFPNPSSDIVTFEFEAKYSGEVTLMIYNQLGEMVKEIKSEHLNSGRQQINLNTQDKKSGLYYYQLVTNGQVYSGKFIVTR